MFDYLGVVMPLLVCCLVALVVYLCRPCMCKDEKIALYRSTVLSTNSSETELPPYNAAISRGDSHQVNLPGEDLPPSYESIFSTRQQAI